MTTTLLGDELFWAKVDVGEPDECWEWQAYRTALGYGQVRRDGKTYTTSRYVMGLQPGDGLEAMHTCDNPPCVNPAHLVVGTHAENMADMRRKGRGSAPRGADNPKSKLTAEQVAEIRERHLVGGETQTALAEEFGVSQVAVHYIVHRRSWKHV